MQRNGAKLGRRQPPAAAEEMKAEVMTGKRVSLNRPQSGMKEQKRPVTQAASASNNISSKTSARSAQKTAAANTINRDMQNILNDYESQPPVATPS